MVTVALLSFVGGLEQLLPAADHTFYSGVLSVDSRPFVLVPARRRGGGGQVLFSIVLTGALVSIVPVIIVFLILQRFWQGGLALGAIK